MSSFENAERVHVADGARHRKTGQRQAGQRDEENSRGATRIKAAGDAPAAEQILDQARCGEREGMRGKSALRVHASSRDPNPSAPSTECIIPWIPPSLPRPSLTGGMKSPTAQATASAILGMPAAQVSAPKVVAHKSTALNNGKQWNSETWARSTWLF